MFKLVLTDYDATLAPPASKHITPFCHEAICELLSCGVRFGPITGRTHARSLEMFLGDETCCATAAYVNGQVIYVNGELAHIECLDRSPLEHVQAILEEMDDAVLTCGLLDEDRSVFIKKDASKLAQFYEDTPWYSGDRRDLPDGPLTKAGVHVHGDMQRVKKIRAMLARKVPELDFVLPGPTLPFIDFLPHGWDKGKAVLKLCELLGIDTSEVVVFGDSENDIAMMHVTKNSVAVANALPNVKKAAHYQIGSYQDDAVAHALLDIAVSVREHTLPSFMSK